LAATSIADRFQQNWDFALSKTSKSPERQELRFTSDFLQYLESTRISANPSINDVETIGTNPASSPFAKFFSTVGTPRLTNSRCAYAF